MFQMPFLRSDLADMSDALEEIRKGKKKITYASRRDICTALCGGMRCELNCSRRLAPLLAHADRRCTLNSTLFFFESSNDE